MRELHSNQSYPWKGLAIGTVINLILGCATLEPSPSPLEQDFGESVKQMRFVQTYDKAAANGPPVKPVEGIDGGLGHNILIQYRTDIAKPPEIKNEITINVGN